MKIIKKTLTGLLALSICTSMISSDVGALQASYYKGDINNDGVINTKDYLDLDNSDTCINYSLNDVVLIKEGDDSTIRLVGNPLVIVNTEPSETELKSNITVKYYVECDNPYLIYFDSEKNEVIKEEFELKISYIWDYNLNKVFDYETNEELGYINPEKGDISIDKNIQDYTEQEDLITDSETIIKMLTEYADENIPRHGYIGIAYDQDSEYILIDTKSEDSVTAGIIKFINENKLDGSNIRIRVSSPTLNDSTDDTTGDVNFDKKVDLTDMSWLSLYLIGDKEFTDAMRKSADIDGDGEVKLADLAKFRQFLSKKISSLG